MEINGVLKYLKLTREQGVPIMLCSFLLSSQEEEESSMFIKASFY